MAEYLELHPVDPQPRLIRRAADVVRAGGLIAYPTEDRFELSYEKSGLYECEGFEVKPGQVVVVTVARHGWALQAKDRLLPIRRARVERATVEVQGQ